MNGHMTVSVTVRNPGGALEDRQFNYELGDSASFVENRAYGLDVTNQQIAGDVTAPILLIDGLTIKAGHRFQFHAEFAYKPDEDLDDGVPYGFRFTTGTIRRVAPLPGENFSRKLEGPSDFIRTVRSGEDEFVRAERQAARFTAVVDQAAMRMRDRGGLR